MDLAQRLENLVGLAAATDSTAWEVSLLAGLAGSHVAKIIHGERKNPTSDTVAALARVLGCTVGYLAAGEGAPPTPAAVRAAVDAARARTASPDAPATHTGAA